MVGLRLMSSFKRLNLDSYPNLLSELNELDLKFKSNQICLNTTVDKPDDYLLGCGSLYYDWSTAKRNDKNELISVDVWDNPLTESDFTEFCSVFSGTTFERLYRDISSQYEVGRVRIMNLAPGRVMTWHLDDSPRLHYPFKTQEGCSMVIDNEVMHLDQDVWWWTDTTKHHTAFNASGESRYHIVAALLKPTIS